MPHPGKNMEGVLHYFNMDMTHQGGCSITFNSGSYAKVIQSWGVTHCIDKGKPFNYNVTKL